MKTLRSLDGWAILRAALIAWFAGWTFALIFGLWIGRLQYTEVSTAFPADQVSIEYAARLDRELYHGPLLLFAQAGVLAGALAWQVGITARKAQNPRLQGAAAGTLLAVVQCTIAAVMQAPWAFIVPLAVVLIIAGSFAGWSAEPDRMPTRG